MGKKQKTKNTGSTWERFKFHFYELGSLVREKGAQYIASRELRGQIIVCPSHELPEP
jgi:hypothetical protein